MTEPQDNRLSLILAEATKQTKILEKILKQLETLNKQYYDRGFEQGYTP
jgi:hypothetical protein